MIFSRRQVIGSIVLLAVVLLIALARLLIYPN